MPDQEFQEFTPYYEMIIGDIRGRIASGEWPTGHQLLSTPALVAFYAQRFGVRSASTVRKAILYLKRTGELRGHKGLGVFVTGRPPPAETAENR